jgi:hypothetical protein
MPRRTEDSAGAAGLESQTASPPGSALMPPSIEAGRLSRIIAAEPSSARRISLLKMFDEFFANATLPPAKAHQTR